MKNVIYSGNQDGWLTAVAGAIMDGGRKPPSVARLLRIVPSKVGPTATNDGHVTAAENGLDRKDFKAGQKIWIDGAIKALRSARLINGDDDALVWLGENGRDYQVKFGTRGKERTITVRSASTRQADRDAYMLGTPDKDPYAETGFGAEGRVMRGDTSPLTVKVRTRQHGKEFINERKFEMHPLALAIPPMTVDEQKAIRASIEKSGVDDAVTLFPDKDDLTVKGNPKLKILDGRHRAYFASITGQPIKTEVFEGTEDEARDLVYRRSIVRRHLTSFQQALVAERFYGEEARQEAAEAMEKARIRGNRSRSSAPANSLESGNGRKRGREAHQIVRDKATGKGSDFSETEARTAAIVIRAPKTTRKVETGEIRRPSVAKREAEAEIRGEPVRKPTAGGAVSKPKSINEHVGSALSSLRTAAETLNLPLGKTTPRDMEKRLDEIVNLAERIKRDHTH